LKDAAASEPYQEEKSIAGVDDLKIREARERLESATRNVEEARNSAASAQAEATRA
jgi:hypothetical protein